MNSKVILKRIITDARKGERVSAHDEVKQVFVEIRLAAGLAIQAEKAYANTKKYPGP